MMTAFVMTVIISSPNSSILGEFEHFVERYRCTEQAVEAGQWLLCELYFYGRPIVVTAYVAHVYALHCDIVVFL